MGDAKKARKESEEKLDLERRAYVAAWSVSSESLDSGGHYDWMAGHLHGRTKILEIGTGVGGGTVALLRRGHLVVSIDENPQCLSIAENKIGAAGYHAVRVQREGRSFTPHGYQLGYRKMDAALPSEGALLVEGDVLTQQGKTYRDLALVDPNLQAWLSQHAPFDAIACWLIGTHQDRRRDVAVAKHKIGSSQEYRLRVQNGVYALADRLLAAGGLLHIVDRGEQHSTDVLRLDCLRGHRDQAEPTSLEVSTEMPQRPYSEPVGGGVAMERSLGTSGRKPQMDQLFLTAILSTKR
jgi:hypothetical protein